MLFSAALNRTAWVCACVINDFALVQLAEMEDRDRQANPGEGEEQRERDGMALRLDALQETADRDVDRERAHDIIQAPLEFVRLELIVTIHAALLAGERGIDRAQDLPVVDRRERRSAGCGPRWW